MLRSIVTALVIAALAAAFAGSALAGGGSLLSGYGGNATTPQVKTTAAPTLQPPVASASTAATPAKGTLPFTGVDVALILAGGAVLVVAGLGLRRGAQKKA